jgi:hypothetical protein
MSIGDRLQAQALNQRDAGNAALGAGELPDTVEIDGDQIPVAELKKGYLRQADYTRKTQELADEKRRAEAVQQELEQHRQFYANVNAFFAKRPDVYQDVEKWAETKGMDAGTPRNLPKSDDTPVVEKPTKAELPPEIQQKLAMLDSLVGDVKDLRGISAKMQVDKAIERLMLDMGVTRREEISPVIEYAGKNWNSTKDYYNNLVDAFKIVKFEEQHENDRRRKEKENAVLFSGVDSEGNPKSRKPGEMLLDAIKKESSPLDLFK